MERKNILLNFLISALLIHGVIGGRNNLLEKTSSEQPKADRKPPVKTVTTEHGDVYDCIDFFEQPAFDHPLLKNHDYHFDMKPSSVPKEIPKNGNDEIKDRFKPKKIGCPRGTVPIRRKSGEAFIEEKPSRLNSQTNDDDSLAMFYAGAATREGIGKLYGVSSTLSLENPEVFYVTEYSSSIISIGDGHEFLHAGWMVNEKLYGDKSTRFFIWMHAAHASCYNTNCPGFVIVNSDYPLDLLLIDANATGEPRYEMRVLIYQEKENGNWWLVGHDNEKIGFWPKRLFNTLSDGASKAYYGGVVGIPPNQPSWAQMGTGNRPDKEEIKRCSFSRHMTIVNKDGNEEFAASKSDILETRNERYVARILRKHYIAQEWTSTILFGGA